MKINKFELARPDNDGDISAITELSIQNTTDEEIALIRTNCILSNKNGEIFEHSHNRDYENNIQPSESLDIDIYAGHINKLFTGDARNDVRIQVKANFYSCDSKGIGETSVPENHTEYKTFKNTIKTDVINPEINIIVSRTETDRDKECNVEFKCALSNITNKNIEKIALITELVDNKDNILNKYSSEATIAANETHLLSDSFWGVKQRELKGAKLRFSLVTYKLIHSAQCESLSTPSDD
jgi:hypothetical protein